MYVCLASLCSQDPGNEALHVSPPLSLLYRALPSSLSHLLLISPSPPLPFPPRHVSPWRRSGCSRSSTYSSSTVRSWRRSSDQLNRYTYGTYPYRGRTWTHSQFLFHSCLKHGWRLGFCSMLIYDSNIPPHSHGYLTTCNAPHCPPTLPGM